jgi:hypothetical protein
MINSANTAIDARCGYFIRAIVGFKGVRPDPDGAFDDSKLTGFESFSSSDKVSHWIADRLAEGPKGIDAWGVDYSALVSSPRWHWDSFLNIDICRCLDAKTSYKHKRGMIFTNKQLLLST